VPGKLSIALLLLGALGCQGWAAPLSPEEAVRRALATHPALKQARALTEAGEAYRQGAGALPNPTLQLAAVSGDPDESANSLSQVLEIAGQPGLRQKIANESAAANAASETALRGKVGLQAALVYYNYWEAAQVAQQASGQSALAAELAQAAAARFALGEISANEKLRLQLLAAQTVTDQVEARGQLKIAEQALSLLLEESGPFELPDTGYTLPLAPLFPLEGETELLASFEVEVERRPELEEARREAAAAQWQAKLAGRAGAPDLQFSLYRSTLGNTAEQGVQLAVVVPLFDWGRQGAEHERDKKLAEARNHQVEVIRREALAEARGAATRYRVAQERREALAWQAAEYSKLSHTARTGYEVGLLGLVEVLDATTAYRQGLRDYIRAEADFHRARVSLWWAVGRAF
jgi:cobalt-zinc-cadmium efflux system outer membrane protein